MRKSMQTYINNQVKYWEQQEGKVEFANGDRLKVMYDRIKPFITISRDYGCGAFSIANSIVQIINKEHKYVPQWAAYDNKILDELKSNLGFTDKLAKTLIESSRKAMTNFFQTQLSDIPVQARIYQKIVEIIRTLAINGHVVIVGRGGSRITRDMVKGFHVRIVAPIEWRTERIASQNKITKSEARKIIEEKTIEREAFLKEVVNYDINNVHNYHMTINNSLFSEDETARIIINAMKVKGFIKN